MRVESFKRSITLHDEVLALDDCVANPSIASSLAAEYRKNSAGGPVMRGRARVFLARV